VLGFEPMTYGSANSALPTTLQRPTKQIMKAEVYENLQHDVKKLKLATEKITNQRFKHLNTLFHVLFNSMNLNTVINWGVPVGLFLPVLLFNVHK